VSNPIRLSNLRSAINYEAGHMKLSNATVASLPNTLPVPNYDRSKLSPKIVHFGVGHFHRAHLAKYLDQLLNSGANSDWAIWGVGIGALSSAVSEALVPQDCLYTLTEKFADGTATTSVVGSIIGIDHATSNSEPVVARLADAETKIISLTITEGGYGLDSVTGKFSGAGDKLIEADLADPASSQSWLGILIQALLKRRDTGAGKVTLMSCDNIPHNGEVARSAVVGFASKVAPDLLPWIAENMTFPNSMVDRVTPGTKDEDRDYIKNTYGLEDAWPVACEPYTLWILEDNFANGRPDFEKVGVTLVKDVLPYELMKLRLANGTHQALCFFGHLLGHTYVHEAIHDPDINDLLIRYIDEEAVPTLAPVPGFNLKEWGRIVIDRFGNPQIQDQLVRICAETSDRIPKFVLPVVIDQIKMGGSTPICAAVIASWSRYAQGSDENGAAINVIDPKKAEVMAAANAELNSPGAFLKVTSIFGGLAENKVFMGQYLAALEILRSSGARVLLRSLK